MDSTNAASCESDVADSPSDSTAPPSIREAASRRGHVWNATAQQRSAQSCLHGWFEACALRNGEQVALRFDEGQLSYRALNEHANRLAHYLRSRGARPGTSVGICLERSAEMIVAVLAVLKAGAAYVPLDPAYPAERLGFMLEDTGTKILLSRRREAPDSLPGDLTVIDLDAAGAELAAQPATNLTALAGASDPAYIIYTSGSTGRPKGVVVEHRNAVHSTWSRMQYYPTPPERCALIPPLAFDASAAAIFWTLSQGGTLCLPSRRIEQDLHALAQWIERHQVTHWLSAPSLCGLLLDQPAERLASLATVIVGGETCSAALVRRLQSLLPAVQVYNEYGPSECTVWSTVFHCPPGFDEPSVPIGRPIANMRAYVLDAQRTPVANGTVGELYLAGDGVTRGYYERSELTAAKFVADPFADPPGRMYKTGDLVRQRSDGQLEFIGRVDRQVKVRGCRVELAEIEAALLRHAAISAAAVTAIEAASGQQQIVAHVVAQSPPSRRQLRDWLHEILPAYMIPAHFVELAALPLTANGKIDRSALPLPARTAPARDSSDAGPVDDVERRLAAIWSRAFDVRAVDRDDDFFDLGGDSLLAAAMFAQIERQLGQVLSLDVLVERPTVRSLASYLREAPSRGSESRVVVIQAGDSGPPLFCLPGIGGNVLEFRRLADRLGPSQAIVGLPPNGLENDRPPDGTIGEIAADAIRRMRTVQAHGPYHLVGFSMGGVVAFEVAQQLSAAGESIGYLAMLDSRLWSPPAALSLADRIRLHWRNLYHTNRRGRWQYLRQRGRILTHRMRRGSLERRDDDVLATLALSPSSRRMAEIHWQAVRAYEPRVYDGEINLFIAQYEPELAAMLDDDPALGWGQWSTVSVKTHRVPSMHAEILRAPELEVLKTHVSGK